MRWGGFQPHPQRTCHNSSHKVFQIDFEGTDLELLRCPMSVCVCVCWCRSHFGPNPSHFLGSCATAQSRHFADEIMAFIHNAATSAAAIGDIAQCRCDIHNSDCESTWSLVPGMPNSPAPVPVVAAAPTHEVVTVYRYENHTLGLVSTMFLWAGEISFCPFGLPTDWHGEYLFSPDELLLSFNCRGRRPYHGVRLFRHDGCWRGDDYKQRKITLTLTGSYAWEWDARTREWY